MVRRAATRQGEVYIGVDGLVKLGDQYQKKDRQDKVHSLKEQIDIQLKDKVLKKLKGTAPGGIETLLAFLAYESVPPLIDSFKGTAEEYMVKASRKEGIGYIYDRLNKLVKELEEENN